MVDNDRVHYHHIAGMGGGYMPDDHGLYDTFESAVQSVENLIAIEVENGVDAPSRVYSKDAFDADEGQALWVGYYPEDVSPHDLGWYYEVFSARDDDPDHEDCRAILDGEMEEPLW